MENTSNESIEKHIKKYADMSIADVEQIKTLGTSTLYIEINELKAELEDANDMAEDPLEKSINIYGADAYALMERVDVASTSMKHQVIEEVKIEPTCKIDYSTRNWEQFHDVNEMNKDVAQTGNYSSDQNATSQPEITKTASRYRRLRCNYCYFLSYTVKNLANHKQKCQPIECLVCKKMIPTRDIAAHMYRHERSKPRDESEKLPCRKLTVKRITNNPIKKSLVHTHNSCHQCPSKRTYNNLLQLKFHQRQHRRKRCPVCRMSVVISSFKRHYKRHKSDKLREKFQTKSSNLNHHSLSKFAPDRRLSQQESSSYNQYNRPFSVQEQGHLQNQHHKRIHCPECGTLMLIKNLKRHLLTHDPLAPRYRCESCDKTFTTHGSLKLHKALQHTAENEKHACDECERIFTNRMQLNKHKRSHILKQCPVCGLNISVVKLKQHLEGHIPDVPRFHCETCNKSFKVIGSLNHHVAMKHTSKQILLQQQSYACDQCKNTFSNQVQLRVHQEQHKRIQCPMCAIDVSEKNFKRHLKVHDVDAVRVRCEACDVPFTTTSCLKAHIAAKHVPKDKPQPA